MMCDDQVGSGVCVARMYTMQYHIYSRFVISAASFLRRKIADADTRGASYVYSTV